MFLNNAKLIQFFNRKRLKNDDFCIVANDCWGAEVYRYLGLPYNTPFVGLYLMAPCYISFLKKIEFNMNSELTFIEKSKYKEVNDYKKIHGKDFPTGSINGIEIQFLHYQSTDDAYEKWNRRRDRMNWNNLFVKFDASKDLATLELAASFDLLSFNNKLCLSDIRLDNIKSNVYCTSWEVDGARMFKKSIQHFSLIRWLNTEGIKKPNLFDKVLRG